MKLIITRSRLNRPGKRARVKKISYLNPYIFQGIEDIENYNLDVFVEFEDGYTWVVTVGSPKNLLYLMNKEKMDFTEPGTPFITVRKMTQEIVEKAIRAYAADDAYWIKFYHFGSRIDNSVFDQLQATDVQFEEEIKEIEKLENQPLSMQDFNQLKMRFYFSFGCLLFLLAIFNSSL